MALERILTARTGFCTIDTANSNLDGTGTLGTILTAGGNGTLVKSLIIKAQTDTTPGMVRVFVASSTTNLILEVKVDAITKSSRDLSYYNVIPLNLMLESGDVLKCSTENSETFNVIAECLDWSYPTSYIDNCSEYIANSGTGIVSTANANLNGSGSVVSVYAAATSKNGSEVSSIVIKAREETTPGVIRFYLQGPSSPYNQKTLFHEVIVSPITPSATNQSFSFQVLGRGSLALEAGFEIFASTEVGEAFAITVSGTDWHYPLI